MKCTEKGKGKKFIMQLGKNFDFSDIFNVFDFIEKYQGMLT